MTVDFADGVEVVGVDGDDTLWHCQDGFDTAVAQLVELLADHADPDTVQRRLDAAETRNLPLYGFGVKSFTLSAVETVLELGGEAAGVRGALDIGRAMLQRPVELLPGAREAVDALAASHRLVLVTKGDLLDQERKLAASGLGHYFVHVEVVSDKHEAAYRELLAALDVSAERFLMVGDSERSDVLPVLAVGGWAVHVPTGRSWWREQVEHPHAPHPRRVDLPDLGSLARLLRSGAAAPRP